MRLGQTLRLAREKRRESIEKVARELHIPGRHIEALEQGDVSVFKAEVYARGAYTKYARYLGVEIETSQAVNRLLRDAREKVPVKALSPREWWQKYLVPRWLFVFGLLVAAAIGSSYVGWQVRSFLRLPRLELDEPKQQVVDASRVTVRGRAEEGSAVKVNEESVLLGEDGSFVFDLWLHEGVNVLVVEAAGPAGRANVVRRDLLLPRS